MNLFREYTDAEVERERRNVALKDARYIYWAKEATKTRIDHEEYNRLSKFLKEHGKPMTSGYKTRRIEWCYDCVYRFDLEARRNNPTIYMSKREGEEYHYYVYFTEMDNEKLGRENGAGCSGWNTLDEAVRKRYKRGLAQIYGVLPVSGGNCWITPCTKRVKQAIYYDKFFVNKKIKNVYKADLKSAFPSALCGRLPDAKTAKMEMGRLAPTEEYPFAFYINSGHVAEYGVFDTHDFLTNKWYKQFVEANRQNCIKRNEEFINFEDIADKDEITVLMRASNIEITEQVKKMFWVKENGDEKKTRDWYKWMLNALIGFMRSEQYNVAHYQGHLAAVVYCRVANRMLRLTEGLEKEGNLPIYFAIDCIMWLGKKSSLTSTIPELGNFMEEINGGSGAICGQGQYYITEPDKPTIEKHQGIAKSIYKSYNISNVDEYIARMGRITEFKEVFDPELNEFIQKEVIK